MASMDKALGLDTKLGALLIGSTAAAIIYGITTVQTFTYFKMSFKDSVAFRGLIYFLWLIDTVETALVTRSLYYYLVTSFGNPINLLYPDSTLIGMLYVSLISDLCIRGIFGYRVWKVTNGNIPLAISIAILSLVHAVFGTVYATKAINNTFFFLFTISYMMYIALATGVAADVLIAGALCYSLSSSRTGFKKTDTIVNTLMVYAINSCVLTSACAAGCLITYAIWPEEFIFIGIFLCLNKLYFNSMLATLNNRYTLREKVSGLSDVPSASHVTGSFRHLSTYPNTPSPYNNNFSMNSVQSPVEIKIERHVDFKPDTSY